MEKNEAITTTVVKLDKPDEYGNDWKVIVSANGKDFNNVELADAVGYLIDALTLPDVSAKNITHE